MHTVTFKITMLMQVQSQIRCVSTRININISGGVALEYVELLYNTNFTYPGNTLYEDVNRRTIEIPQCIRTFKAHNVP